MANDITFSMTYYGQIERLQYQLDFFRNSSRELREHVTLQIINDGYNDAGLFFVSKTIVVIIFFFKFTAKLFFEKTKNLVILFLSSSIFFLIIFRS